MLNEFHSVLAGVACGDALGWPVEFMSVRNIKAKYGPNGITSLDQTNRQFTDDTQMSVALAEGLLDAKAVLGATPDSSKLADSNYIMPFVAQRFADWSVSPKNNRAPGNTCMAACRALVSGTPWNRAGVVGSKGCGAAMRVAAIGLLYEDAEVLGRIARASARCTHAHAVAEQAAHIAALAVRLLIDGAKPQYLLGMLLSHVEQNGGLDKDFGQLLGRVPDAVHATVTGVWRPEEIQVDEDTHHLALGEAWKADSAVACALYCFLLAVARKDGYVETVRYGANTEGDSDSIAAIAGSFAGAHWGLHGDKGVPAAWTSTIEDAQELADLARRLAACNQDMRKRSALAR